MKLFWREWQKQLKNKVHIAKSKSGIVVKGIDDMAVRFSRCCNPVPGDEIVGFVTRGRGLSIHRTDCINMIHLSESERARLIPAEWETEVTEKSGGQYLAEIKMYANDQQGLLMEISRIFTEGNVDVKSMNVRTSKKERQRSRWDSSFTAVKNWSAS